MQKKLANPLSFLYNNREHFSAHISSVPKNTLGKLFFQPLLRKLFPSYENVILSLENEIIILGNFSKRGSVKMH